MILSLYRAAMHLGRPLATAILRRRVAQGKEDALRLGERRGVAARPRPVTPRLIWIHAASVGESVSALPLINHILDDDPDAYLLLTTGTRTSAALMADRLPARALHQYVPVDRPAWIKRFLAHWRPCVAIFIENEIWPNLIIESKAIDLPLILVNGRLSARSFKRWRWMPGMARALFSRFDLILAVDATSDCCRRRRHCRRCRPHVEGTARPTRATSNRRLLQRRGRQGASSSASAGSASSSAGCRRAALG
ncbi:MAG: glycosyltransferase N-terminal domain-containing protein, partial [Pseudomonadota bacterium]|nr:glycosyltransferase N-terminal domain-containing protein [Pseudomonadota bacterium]